MTKALLALADGRVFDGESFGASGEAGGEVVFNTSMTGYQEILSDPSYCGQMVAMTYPEIGNVGVNLEDIESRRAWVQGFIVKEYWEQPSNWRSRDSLGNYLRDNGIPGIQGIDTRALVRHVRDNGAQEAVLSSVDLDPDSLIAKAKARPGLVGKNLVEEVSCKEAYDWEEGLWQLGEGYAEKSGQTQYFVVAYDFGVKRNILRHLVAAGCRVRVVPASTSADEVLAMNPDGIFLSNGPGDPDVGDYASIVGNLIGKKPIFGICLGHQILALALGGKTYKLRFGHHGGNQPVMDMSNRKTEITSQNHGFAVDAESLSSITEVGHLNLNDQTVEGLSHRELPLFSVQYHPEASPGPHDAKYLFGRFIEVMKR